MKRLKKLAASLPNSAKLSLKHTSKLKGGGTNVSDAGSDDHDKRLSSGS